MNLLTEDKGAVRILTLNRPEKRNALDTALTRDLLEALRTADADETVHCVVLTGTGPGFCAGADLSEFKGLQDAKAAETRAELTMQLHLAFSKMITPVVTAINGAAMGGGAGLAIAGDLAVMAESARARPRRQQAHAQLRQARQGMKPLAGITILDLSRVLACPFASMILAELGARVIKVEQPGTGDETRTFEPQLAKDSAYYFVCNRSKESITVNLRTDEGRKLVRELAQKADVFVENFPVGTLGRYGLDFATLSALNPRLIYVSCTGFGQTGPYKNKKGYDTVFQAMGGIMSLTGERGGGPVKPGLPVADLSSGLWVAISILAALAGRDRTGKGCLVDFSMLDGQVALLTLAAARYFALGEVPPRPGTQP